MISIEKVEKKIASLGENFFESEEHLLTNKMIGVESET